MTYRRKVHCRYCGDTGHNVNGCPKVKEYVKNNPNSWYAQKAAQRAESAKHRKCSYCSNEGHNRKTCSHIMADMIKVAGINQDFRKKFIENVIKKNGVAPGALITVDETSGYGQDKIYRYDLKDKMALVIGFNFSEVKYPNPNDCYAVKVQFMDVYDYGGSRLAESNINIPDWYVLGKDPPTERWMRHKVGFTVVSPGYYDMDNEEEWIKNKEAVEEICASYGNHTDLQYAFDRIVLNK